MSIIYLILLINIVSSTYIKTILSNDGDCSNQNTPYSVQYQNGECVAQDGLSSKITCDKDEIWTYSCQDTKCSKSCDIDKTQQCIVSENRISSSVCANAIEFQNTPLYLSYFNNDCSGSPYTINEFITVAGGYSYFCSNNTIVEWTGEIYNYYSGCVNGTRYTCNFNSNNLVNSGKNMGINLVLSMTVIFLVLM